ncbi:MAG: 50S ribosomal protein L5 [Candidatus Bathyarchaeota archaeon]
MSQPKIVNPMQQPRIEKVVVNIAVGKSGEPLQKAMAVLEQLTGQKPCQRLAKVSVRDWGIRKFEPIACIVTLRDEMAINFLRRTLDVVGNKLPKSSFDATGNFSFGIKEHIDIPGVKYDPALGIFGMDLCVAMERPGYHVKKRKILRAKIGKNHRLTPEETIEYVKETLGIELL